MIQSIRQKPLKLWPIGAYGLVGLSFFLRVYQLNNVAVDKGELMTITWFIRNGLFYILTHNKDLNNHPLNSVLAYLTSGNNESIFTLRWHSVVIGVLTVALVLRLGRELFGRRDGFIAGLLLATSAYHASFSQISRGYAGLIGFALFGFYFVYKAVESRQKRYWVAFALVSVLNIYNHLYGAMAVAVLALVGLIMLLRRDGLNRSPTKLAATLSPLVVSLVVTYLVALAMYVPMLADTIAVVGQNNQFRQSDLRQTVEPGLVRYSQPFVEAIRPFSLTEDATRVRIADPAYHYTSFDWIALLAENKVGFYLSLGTFLLGLVFSWRRFRWHTLLLSVWLFTPFVVQLVGGLVLPGSYFRGRFLAFIYGPYLLLLARGWPGLADWLAERFAGRPALSNRSHSWPSFAVLLTRTVTWAGVAVLVGLNLTWLGVYYAAAKQEQWQNIAQHVAQNFSAHDVIICGQRYKTACDSDLSTRIGHDVKEASTLVTPENIEENRVYLEQPGRVWLIMPRMPVWQVDQLEAKLAPGHYWLAGNPPADRMGWVLVDSGPTLADNLAGALHLAAGLSLDGAEASRNYLTLTQLYLGRGQVAEAEQAFAQAVELLPEGTSPDSAIVTQLEYARQAAESLAALPPTAAPVDLNFEQLVRLVGYEVNRQQLSPGQSVRVTLYWQPLARIDQDLITYVHLTDLNGKMVGRSSGSPAGGQAPTSTWQAGQLIVDPHEVPVGPEVQAPLVATVQAGLFDPLNQRFIQAINQIALPVDSTLFEIKIVPATWPSAQPAHKLVVNFANLILLTGYDLVPEPPAIVFYWQARATMSEDYTVFVHLFDAQGELVGQIDGQPLQGNYPTSRWSPGEVIVDWRPVSAIAPGNYRLLAGWYRLADGSRLPLADGPGDSAVIGTITIP